MVILLDLPQPVMVQLVFLRADALYDHTAVLIELVDRTSLLFNHRPSVVQLFHLFAKSESSEPVCLVCEHWPTKR